MAAAVFNSFSRFLERSTISAEITGCLGPVATGGRSMVGAIVFVSAVLTTVSGATVFEGCGLALEASPGAAPAGGGTTGAGLTGPLGEAGVVPPLG